MKSNLKTRTILCAIVSVSMIMIASGFVYNFQNYKYVASVIIRNDTIVLSKNKVVQLVGSDSLTFKFDMPKAEEYYIDFYVTEEKSDYYKYLKGKPLESIKAFKYGNSFSVSTNAYKSLTNEIIVSSEGHQPYVYENPDFMSFHRMKSTDTHDYFYYDAKGILYINDSKNIQEVIPFNKVKFDTLYCLLSFSYKNEKWKEMGVTAFKIAIK